MSDQIGIIKAYFIRQFNRFTVQIEPIPSEPQLLGIGVYGVPKQEMNWVRREISDAEERLFSSSGFGLIPLVRSRENTEKYYPLLLKPWNSGTSLSGLRDTYIVTIQFMENCIPFFRDNKWTTEIIDASTTASNKEMLLVA